MLLVTAPKSNILIFLFPSLSLSCPLRYSVARVLGLLRDTFDTRSSTHIYPEYVATSRAEQMYREKEKIRVTSQYKSIESLHHIPQKS